MKPTTKLEVLVLLVFLATILPASLAIDRTTISTRNTDRATSHESNSDLSNQLCRIRFLKEGEKIKRFMYLLMSEILLCVIILVQLLHVALIHQPKLTFSEDAILGRIHDSLPFGQLTLEFGSFSGELIQNKKDCRRDAAVLFI